MSARTTYTLTIGATTLTFTRPAGDGFDRWFAEGGDYTASRILRGAARQVVIDVAGASWPALTLTAEFTSSADVATCRGLVRQSGTLSNTRGRSASVYLASAAEPEGDNIDYGRTLELTFERLS